MWYSKIQSGNIVSTTATREMENAMVKALTKQPFGSPSVETTERIDSNASVAAARTAGYAFETKLAELRRQYVTAESRLHAEYLGELAALGGEEAEGA
jgi:hypothetical protein